MHRMAGMDASFLYFETPTMLMHIVGVVVLDPADVDGAFGSDEVIEVLQDRLHLIPPLRWRALRPPVGIDHPMWIEDPDFDLADHVTRVSSDQPMSWHDLEDLVGDIAGQPLRRDRPMWEMWVVEDLEEGLVALVTKIHHSLMDGGGGGDLMASIFDLSADAPPIKPPAEPWAPDEIPSSSAQITSSLSSLAARQRKVPGALARTTSSLVASVRTWASQRSGGDETPLFAPRTLLNGVLSQERAVSLTRVDLDTVREVRHAFGTTINDVVLAASGTALRNSLLARGQLPERDLIAAVPVSVRSETAHEEIQNRTSNMMVEIPIHPGDPVERLMAVHAKTSRSKALQTAFGSETLAEMTSFAFPLLMSTSANLYTRLGLARLHPPVFNLIISNVPGPPIDLYCAGAKVVGIFPMGPVMEGSGVNITVLSESNHLNIGVMACPKIVPDVDEIGAGIVAAVSELSVEANRV